MIMIMIIIMVIVVVMKKVSIKRKILFEDNSKSIHAHKHTHAAAHANMLTTQKLIYTQLETGSKQRIKTDEGSSRFFSLSFFFFVLQILSLLFSCGVSFGDRGCPDITAVVDWA